jgi:hypothetical protein
MTVETYCDRCGMEFDWAPVSVGDLIYCCTGCASGGPCTCARTIDDGVVAVDRPVVIDDEVLVVD